MNHGFIRVACATPEMQIADCKVNAERILTLIESAHKKNVPIIVFPELSISGYTCGNLFFSTTLQKEALEALSFILEKTKDYEMLIIVGIPLSIDSKLYNCAAVLCKGKILGLVPKENLPNYSQYSEMRYFAEGCESDCIQILGQKIPFGTNLIFAHKTMSELRIGIEICEDLWVSNSPSNRLAQYGATVIANLSASDEKAGKPSKRRNLINFQSSKLVAAYLYANAGQGESSTDLVFSGHNVISECGEMLIESEPFTTGLIIADVDLQLIEAERQRLNTFKGKCSEKNIYFDIDLKKLNIKRKIPKNPFIINNEKDEINSFCEEVFNLQVEGLAVRLKNIGMKKIVLGLSGGVDSTLALLISIYALKKLKYDKKNIICVSMPGFGTSDVTKSNSKKLAESFGVSYKEISIEKSVKQHFIDIGKNDNKYDTTYENAQARERTQILMDLANMHNAIVVGTGDLSEIALGFSTYNGDHMSMYNVNAGVPKTLVQMILTDYASNLKNKDKKEIIENILKIPVSPELLPTNSEIPEQITEEIMGPYELHDFFIYYFLRYGFSVNKILKLATIAFEDKYKQKEIKKCLSIFISRFFNNQFKRSCQPDGPTVLDISLSPRNTFMMPSDIKLPENLI